MPGTLNLGIVAHVDAGKTTLTERLLYAAGVIESVGSVDAGTTQTDTLALERQRGITIKSAVVTFDVAGVRVNLIDTPGHPDFIAEVERVLSLLDGALLVISAVEGVQPQTRVLMRALKRLRVPTFIFVNKIDRGGADPSRTLAAIRQRLAVPILAMGAVEQPGTRAARFVPYDLADTASRAAHVEVLADRDDSLLAAFVADEGALTPQRLRRALVSQTRRCLVHPVYFGSAITGEGVDPLRLSLVELLPTEAGDPGSEPSGRVFKIDRGAGGERIAYVRMFTGSVQVRQRLMVHAPGAAPTEAKLGTIEVSESGGWMRRPRLVAGEIGRVAGLAGVRVGDTIGRATDRSGWRFPPPTIESVVLPVRPGDGIALRGALAALAEQDPLINVRTDETGHEVSISLYGDVQKEVVQATLASEFGIDVTFQESTTICIERPRGVGEALEVINTEANPFQATIGLRVEPASPGSGVEFVLQVEPQSIPMYVYKSVGVFADAMAQYVRDTLREGLYGWQVTDCRVTMFDSAYSVADGPPSRRGPDSTAADFRRLTPMVLMRALDFAATVVCEPTLRTVLEVPVWSIAAVVRALTRLGAPVIDQSVRGDLTSIESLVPAARLSDLHRALPGLTSGEGVMESTFDGYRPVRGPAPARPRTTVDPRRREEYLISLTRQGRRADGRVRVD